LCKEDILFGVSSFCSDPCLVGVRKIRLREPSYIVDGTAVLTCLVRI
jgi:hypothetical protein